MPTTCIDNTHYTDARYSQFTYVVGNQHISHMSSSADTFLTSLKPVSHQRFVTPCMEGTREGVFRRIDSWMDGFDAHNILWISGSPGVGKSAIMSSLESRLRMIGRFGASFFFDRGNVSLSDPTALWRTVAFDLARKYPLMAKRLVKNLQDDKVDPGRPDIESHFRYLIQDPLSCMWVSTEAGDARKQEQDTRKGDKEFSDGVRLATEEQLEEGESVMKPPVILIDALDECGSDDSQFVQRNILLNTLTHWSHLHTSIKLVVTSRDGRIPPLFADVCDHIVLETGDLVSSEENDDIQKFMECRFAQIAPRYPSLPPNWPGQPIIKHLTECAAGLFIWADTTIRYIEQGIATERLDFILAGRFPEGDRIDSLYRQILDTSFKDTKSQICQKFKAVVGAIVLAKTPLRYVDIKHFIGQRIDHPSIDFILQKLSSVLSTGTPDGCVHVSHASFTEFVCDAERCHAKFAIHRSTHSGCMALACLRNMSKGLKFNICRLETSYLRNDEVLDLPSRIEKTMSPCLLYSCRFFADHLSNSTNDNTSLLQEIESFLHTNLLYWLEVMSLCNQVPEAVTALHILTCWLEAHNGQLATFAADAGRFVMHFQIPISTSAPHIYLSALPFSPRNCLVSRCYLPRFPNTISVISGQENRWSALINILVGHTKAVSSVTFSSDGRHVISGSWDQTIRVWDAETGQLISGPLECHTQHVTSVASSSNGMFASGSDDQTLCIWDASTHQIAIGPLTGHTDKVRSVAFSPDGKHVVSSSDDRKIFIWDVETGQMILDPLEGHTDDIRSVAFSPDGRRVVSGSEDCTIRIWDVEVGVSVCSPLKGHTHIVTSVVFSPDGGHVVSGSGDRTIRIWDSKTGMIICRFPEHHTSNIMCVAFSPDGSRIVSGSDDRTVYIWNAETGQIISGPFEGHTDNVSSVAFSPDGKRIASGSADHTIRMWNAEKPKAMPGPLKNTTHFVKRVRFSRDGKHVISGSDDNKIRVWDAKTGEVVSGPPHKHASHVWCVAFSPDGRHAISGTKNRVRIWDAETRRIVSGPLAGHTDGVRCVVFSPDGKRAASGSADCTICIWDVETGRIVSDPLKGHTKTVRSVAFSPDGKRVISGSEDHTICIWDIEIGRIVSSPLQGHTHSVISVAFSPTSRHIISGSADRTIRIWDVGTGQLVCSSLKVHTNDIKCVAISPDGRHVISGSADRTICFWNAETLEVVHGPLEGHTGYVTSVAFSPDGKRVVSGSGDRTLIVWDVKTGQIVTGPLRGHSGYIRSVAILRTSRRAMSGSDDGFIRTWDIETGRIVSSGRTHHIRSIAFSPDGKRAASGSGDRTIRIWDSESGENMGNCLRRHARSVISSVAFSPSGKHVVSGSTDSTVRIWDAETGQIICGPLHGHTRNVRSVAFSPDERHIVSGSADQTIRIWAVATGNVVSGALEGHTRHVRSVAFSPDGTRVVSGSDDQTVRIWDVGTGQMVSSPFKGHSDKIRTVAFSPNGRCVASGSADHTVLVWDVETGQIVSGPLQGHTKSVSSIAFSSDGKFIVSGANDAIRVWNVEGSGLIQNANLYLSYEWITSLNSVASDCQDPNRQPRDNPKSLVLWVPPACRGGICGDETVAIIGASMTRVDFSSFAYGSSWERCFSPTSSASGGNNHHLCRIDIILFSVFILSISIYLY